MAFLCQHAELVLKASELSPDALTFGVVEANVVCHVDRGKHDQDSEQRHDRKPYQQKDTRLLGRDGAEADGCQRDREKAEHP